MHSIVKYCFLFFLISRILRGTHRTDLFVEVTNLMKGNIICAHYTSTGYYPTLIKLSRQIPKENVSIKTSWCCFKTMHIDWDNAMVMGISGIKIDMPSDAKVSIFTDNNLAHINDDHFEINLVVQLLNQIYIVPVLPSEFDYDNDDYDDSQHINRCNCFCTSIFIHSMNVYSISTQLCKTTLYTFTELYLKS